MHRQAASLRAAWLGPGYWPTWLMLGLVRTCARLPRPMALTVGGWIVDLFFRVNEKRRAIARINIELCFPELDAAEREDRVRRHFRAYGRNIVDLGLIWWASERRLSALGRGGRGIVKA